ncbi:hypothetical protein Val02_58970 [Virgisporangium aliadipatigenens]|uniref:Uncharacterized protein n=1 Tax=Virgisporangium aliadipatigenens TaxID=741659 RepID=A0A8J3YSH3_9ACTN|nr:hypothetical protein [Virgisporangium aliadipatigenens]GIJ49011.1 hypothetical protein Val02_58970 [Virgisporangium aliadipatigenens]
MQKDYDVLPLTVTLVCGLPLIAALVALWLLYARPALPLVEERWRGTTAVGVVGATLTVILAFLPIVVRIPGDHESAACGNAVRLTWTRSSLTDSETGRSTYDECVLTRNVRRVAAIATLSGTTLIVGYMIRVRRRATGDAEHTSGTPAT